MKLKEYKERILNGSDKLKEITPEKEAILEMLCWKEDKYEYLNSNDNLINRTSTVIDFMMISDDDFDQLQKVYCLRDSFKIFASTIKEMDQNSDYAKLIESIEKLWKYLKDGRDFSKKYASACQDTTWFEILEKKYSETDKNALGAIKKILENGIFIIKPGKITIKEDKDFTYEDMKDFLARLTLYGGRDKNLIDALNRRIDNLTKLYKCLEELRKNGNYIFSDYIMELTENPQSDFNVNFRLSVIDEKFPGKKFKINSNGERELITVDNHLTVICTKLDIIKEEWNNLLMQKRNEFVNLNFFTNHQILTLQRELSEYLKSETLSKELIDLCSLLFENCNESHIIKATERSKSEINEYRKKKTAQATMDSSEESSGENLNGINEESKQVYQDLKERLTDCDYNPLLIEIAAQKFCNLAYDDALSEAYQFCVDNEDDQDNIHQHQQSIKELLDKSSEREKGDNIAEDIYHIWKCFLNSLQKNKNIIGIDHLGIILNNLYSIRAFEPITNVLEITYPTLLLWSGDNLWEVIFSIFFIEKKNPLLSMSHILLADEYTTFDEIDLFFKRAGMFPKELFLLLNAHKLNFDTADAADKKIYKIECDKSQFLSFLILLKFEKNFFFNFSSNEIDYCSSYRQARFV